MLAVIPARGGSRGVPKKNIKSLAGKPLIAYTLEAAREADIFQKIVVSTDSKEIADVAISYGAEVPFLRPANLAGDFVSSDDVVLHALAYYQQNGIEFDTVCKLQPTSPFRNERHLKEAYQILCGEGVDFVVSVCECEHSPLWTAALDEKNSLDGFLIEEVKNSCRQKLPVYYRLNGAIYMGKTKEFYKNKSFFGKNGRAYIMEQSDSIDIDSQLDFRVAEILKMIDYQKGEETWT